jgi:23S rRNA (cytosine1962-C5)-methyltransferase
MGCLYLKRGRAKPFYFGHPWVFSGSVARVDGGPADGEVVEVLDHRGNFVARGFYNSRSQIRARLVTWDPDEAIDLAFFERRLRLAISLREDVLRLPAHTDAYRVVYSEADGLPGLIVDRYADWLVVQMLSIGMARRKDALVEALARACPGKGIFERSDTDVHEKEGIDPHVGPLAGAEPPQLVGVTMHGVRLEADLRGGQKTGLFLDHRDNYRAILPYTRGRRVLDCFCYTGAFAIFAMARGHATEALAIELSEAALLLARRNAELNGAHGIAFCQGNVFGELRRLRGEGESFGLILLDPPKFARSAADVPKALRGYRDINLVAMQCLEPGGILVSCSCSQHVDEPTFEAMLNDAANDVGREVQALERRGQAADHPVAAACPESRYLKCLICRVL